MAHEEHTVSPAASTRQIHSSEKDLLFSEDSQNTEAHDDVPPSVNATPDEVRDFITRLLTNRRGLPQEHVRRAVAKWIVGSGQELRSYSPSMYLDLFGREDGWIIYREVKLCMYREQKKSSGGYEPCEFCSTFFSGNSSVFRLIWLLDIITVLVVLLEMVFVSVARSNKVSDGLKASAIMASIFGGVACLLACFHCLPEEPGHLIEDELRSCTKRTATTAQD